MPTTNSAKKRLRQSEKLRAANRAKRSTLRSQIRTVREAAAAGDIETSEAAFQIAVKRLDKAAASNLIHANAAARTKSRLVTTIKAAKASA
jgi:small subunit ribosomal protein S20